MDDKDRELSNDELVAQRDDAVEENKNYRKFFREIVIFGLGALIVGLGVAFGLFLYMTIRLIQLIDITNSLQK